MHKPSAKDFSYGNVSPFNFLMIDEQGDPNTALEVLYAVAEKIKIFSEEVR